MVKKISKKFESFEAEEKWLMELAQDGWRLVSYEDNDIDTNTYKFIEDPSASKLQYQIDYRTFNTQSDYEEYKELFAESGWTILTKSWFYSKHIFISTTKSKIFSDNTSKIEREINRYRVAKLYAGLFVLQAIITTILYFYTDYAFFYAATIFGISGAAYNVNDAMKRYEKLPPMNLRHGYSMKFSDELINFIMKQETFIRIGFYAGSVLIILLAGYLVGGFIGRITE